MDGDTIAGAITHARDPGDPAIRNLVYGAVANDYQRVELDGQRVSDALFQAAVEDIRSRAPETDILTGLVHPDNARSLKWCKRFGLEPDSVTASGMIIVAGGLPEARQIGTH